MTLPKAAAPVALGLSLVLIAAMTLSPTGGSPHTDFRWRPSLDARHFVEAVLNALLFAPFGAATRLVGVPQLASVAIATLLSVAVEMTQLFAVTGRFAELQDIVANMIGAWLGWVILDRSLATTAD